MGIATEFKDATKVEENIFDVELNKIQTTNANVTYRRRSVGDFNYRIILLLLISLLLLSYDVLYLLSDYDPKMYNLILKFTIIVKFQLHHIFFLKILEFEKTFPEFKFPVTDTPTQNEP